MDRSFLSQKSVIEASREYICIRLATYEDEKEVAYLTKTFTGSQGTLENTVFAIMSPDARKYLVQPGRGPNHAFYNADDMAKKMRSMAADYKSTGVPKALPTLKDFRLALNVAASDNMPCVVGVAETAAERNALNEKLAEIAWSPDMLGKTAYAPSSSAAEVAKAKLSGKPGVYVVQPDAYGLSGKILTRMDGAADVETLKAGVKAALAKFASPTKEAQTHISSGVRDGVYWKTATPVTDPHNPFRAEPGKQ
jgi:hypothetical protein